MCSVAMALVSDGRAGRVEANSGPPLPGRPCQRQKPRAAHSCRKMRRPLGLAKINMPCRVRGGAAGSQETMWTRPSNVKQGRAPERRRLAKEDGICPARTAPWTPARMRCCAFHLIRLIRLDLRLQRSHAGAGAISHGSRSGPEKSAPGGREAEWSQFSSYRAQVSKGARRGGDKDPPIDWLVHSGGGQADPSHVG